MIVHWALTPPILNFIVVNNHLINKYERCPHKKKKKGTVPNPVNECFMSQKHPNLHISTVPQQAPIRSPTIVTCKFPATHNHQTSKEPDFSRTDTGHIKLSKLKKNYLIALCPKRRWQNASSLLPQADWQRSSLPLFYTKKMFSAI